MTKVSFEKYGDKISKLVVSGHSGYSEEGSDIVCAAVSSSVNLAASVLDCGGAEFSLNVGKRRTTLILEVDDGELGQTVMKALVKELSALSADFPENVKVTAAERIR